MSVMYSELQPYAITLVDLLQPGPCCVLEPPLNVQLIETCCMHFCCCFHYCLTLAHLTLFVVKFECPCALGRSDLSPLF